MKLKFKSVSMKNFLSFEDATVDLDKSGYTMVKGINQNVQDMALSNGSGKSSIWEAICWVLTGDTIRGTKDVKRFECGGTCEVTLVFCCDNNSYTVTRTKDPSNLRLFVNNEDKSGKGIRDTEKILHEYLPQLTSNLLGSVIILGQGLPMRFTNNTPSGRKDVLEKISESDFMICDLKDRLNKYKTQLDLEIRKYEDIILKSNTQVESLTLNLQKCQERLNSLQQTDIDELKTTINTLQDKKNELQNTLDRDNESYEEMNNKCMECQHTKMTAQKDKIQKESEIKDKYSSNLLDITTKKTNLQFSISQLQKYIDDINNMKDTCPTCHQKLKDFVRPDITKEQNQLQQYSQEMIQLQKSLDNIENQKQQELSRNSNYFVDVLNALQKDIEELTSTCTLLKNNCAANQKLMNDTTIQLDRLTYTVDNIEKDILQEEHNIQDISDQIDKLQDNILYNNNVKQHFVSHKEVVDKMNTIVTRDFRGYLLSTVIDFINKRSKDYSVQVFGSEVIDFILDGNNINICYCGKQYENLSGGEKQKIDLIVQLSIRDMLCTFQQFSSNIIVFDELFDNLDSMGCQNVLNLISSKLSDVDNIYIVSHHTDIQIPYDQELTVIKGVDGISRIA